jgi:hypothetical protein
MVLEVRRRAETIVENFGLEAQYCTDKILRSLSLEKVSEHPQGMFTKKVPIKEYIPAVLEYGRTKKISINVNGVSLFSIEVNRFRPTSDYLQIEYKLNGDTRLHNVDYLSEDMRRFCLGQVVNYGPVFIRGNAAYLTPMIKMSEGYVEFHWGSNGPQIALREAHWSIRLLNFLRATKVQLKSIRVSETDGEIVTSGLAGYFIPDLRWT